MKCSLLCIACTCFIALEKAGGCQHVKPAEGVQTLSEYSTFSWLNGGEADGTVIFCAVWNKVLFFCGQKIHVVPLALLLLCLYNRDNHEFARGTGFRPIIQFISIEDTAVYLLPHIL